MNTNPLPTIVKPTTIDGTTDPIVQINGGGQAFDGLTLGGGSGGSTIEGLEIVNFGGNGIVIQSQGNLIGGVNAGNIIGSEGGAGILISGEGATGNTVEGNDIGTDSLGAQLTNADGVDLLSAGNTVGGLATGTGNVIGFSTSAGVSISAAAATGNVVAGNMIGTNANGLNLGNGSGVVITDASDNTIGGTAAGSAAANSIAFSAGAAVTVETGTGNAIRQNLIYDNGTAGSSGIVLTNHGNANGNTTNPQLAPTIVAATSVPGLTTVQVSLPGFTAGNYEVDFYASAVGDTTGTQVQAHVFLGTETVSSSGTSIETFNTTLTSGQQVTATATSESTAANPNDTSQFATATGLSDAFSVVNTADSGVGSLRQAITDANQNPGTYTISFDIPSGPFKISLATSLPQIKNPVLLDGTSQPHYAGTPIIQIDGQTHSIAGDALDLASTSTDSRIRGLDIYGFSSGAAIDVQLTGDVIQSNYLGTDVTGTTAIGNQDGVWVNGVTGSTIGGVTSVGNLISGNTIGILIQGSSDALVGGNLIGTNASGTVGLANTTAGIQIISSSNDNTIGATATGSGNVIAFNTNGSQTAIGVDVVSGMGDTIRGNSMFGNDQAIILNTANSANHSQAPPTLTYATTYSGSTIVEGELLTGFSDSTTYHVDLYASAVGDTLTTSGQAHIYLGSESVTTGTNGTVAFNFTANVPVPVGQVITATATDPTGDTSQFANSPNFTDTTSATVVNAFVVTTNSNLLGTQTGFTSLAQAITNANADTTNTSADTISFDISGSTTITLTAATLLPQIKHPVIIDGTSQPGYTGAPLIVIDGNGVTGDGLQLITGSAKSTIKGLDIVDFVGVGIEIQSNNNSVQSNYLGINPAGTAAGPGNTVGVQIDNAASNTIGGSSGGAGNVIAYNSSDGVVVNGATSTSNTIRQNSIYNNPANSQAAKGILLESGANSGQQPLTDLSVTSSGGQTTIKGDYSGFTSGATYTLEFFASAIGDNNQPDQAAQFPGQFIPCDHRHVGDLRGHPPGDPVLDPVRHGHGHLARWRHLGIRHRSLGGEPLPGHHHCRQRVRLAAASDPQRQRR